MGKARCLQLLQTSQNIHLWQGQGWPGSSAKGGLMGDQIRLIP